MKRFLVARIILIICLSSVVSANNQGLVAKLKSSKEAYNIAGKISSEIEIEDIIQEDNRELKFNYLEAEIDIYKLLEDTSLKFLLKKEAISQQNYDQQFYNGKISGEGIRLQYTGIDFATLGLKGSLANDYFIKRKLGYDREGNYSEVEDIGLRFFANLYFNIFEGLTIGSWNNITVDQLDSNRPKPHQSFDSTITLTPKFIYKYQFVEGVNFLLEGVVEFRNYSKRTIDIGGEQHDSYQKLIIKPHFNTDKEIWPGLKLTSYNNFSYEDNFAAKNPQYILRSSPLLEYKKGNLSLGVNGGGYEFQDRMGLTYNFHEMIGYKITGDYSSLVFSVLPYFEWRFKSGLSLGTELAYKSGEWDDGVNSNSLIQSSFNPYLTKEFIINNNLKLYSKLGYKRVVTEYEEKLEEDIIELKIGSELTF